METPILPSVKEDSKTQKEINFVKSRSGSDESSSLIGANKKIATLTDKVDKNFKGPQLEVQAKELVSKTKKESAVSGNTAKVEKGFKNYFAENNGKKYPVYVYYGGYDMNSSQLAKGFYHTNSTVPIQITK